MYKENTESMIIYLKFRRLLRFLDVTNLTVENKFNAKEVLSSIEIFYFNYFYNN